MAQAQITQPLTGIHTPKHTNLPVYRGWSSGTGSAGGRSTGNTGQGIARQHPWRGSQSGQGNKRSKFSEPHFLLVLNTMLEIDKVDVKLDFCTMLHSSINNLHDDRMLFADNKTTMNKADKKRGINFFKLSF